MLQENVLDSLPKEIFSSQLIFNIISRYQDKTKKNSDDAWTKNTSSMYILS